MMDIKVENRLVSLISIKKNEINQLIEWLKYKKDCIMATGCEQSQHSIALEEKIAEDSSNNMTFIAWVCNKEGRRIGIIKGLMDTNNFYSLWIKMLLIDVNDRRKGYGRLTVTGLVEFLSKQYPLKRVCVSVILDNTDGLAFWYSLGFKAVKQIENHSILEGKLRSVVVLCKELEKNIE